MQGQGSLATFDFQKEMAKQINLAKKIGFEVTQKALKASGELLVKKMSSNTMTNGTGLFKQNWELAVYPNSVYVFNKRGVVGINSGIPISNLTEYASRGPRPFIRSTFEANKQSAFNEFSKEIKRNLRRI